eukprot:CAMPEP_0195285714 /NCGR_PEP_ID=MMETSP0707-20130614/3448_1 /TAXON_ID=33640 /ORGANISM="Asterionellopsis glacialis, Strain CCMP134" /LENGTH=853 /DNA_ID=CAMNT_0040345247 /DNA_START=1061 /DNA_END=3622 /DNA_ORIENTATION=+
MLVPPLKAPKQYDLREPLTQWLPTSDVGISAAECKDDLKRLASLRHSVTKLITKTDSHAVAKEGLDDLREYHATLLEFESRGITGAPIDGGTGAPLPPESGRGDSAPSSLLSPWSSAFTEGKTEYHTSLYAERACVLWNIFAIEAHIASVQDNSSKVGLGQAVKHWKSAATVASHLQRFVEEHSDIAIASVDLHLKVCLFWEKVMVAQAQMGTYEMARFGKARTPHLLLAKLAIATVPILNESLALCQDPTLQHIGKNEEWGAYCKAWSLFLNAKAEYHDASVNREKSKWGMELARLSRALTITQECTQFLSSVTSRGTVDGNPSLSHSLTELGQKATEQAIELQDRSVQATEDNDHIYHEVVPNELLEIRGELLAKTEKTLPTTMTELKAPMFSKLLSSAASAALERYEQIMDTLLYQMSSLVEEQTEAARNELARVNLPHSLTAYRQEQSGGGIPLDLWCRVETIQRDKKMQQLKNDLWELRDKAEAARSTYSQASRQMEEDMEMDALFRQHNPGFEGLTASEVQKEVRQTLLNYEKLLSKSQAGDSVLLKRLEILDTDPKYKLLTFQKSQLDRLLPGAAGGDRGGATVDTTELSRLLVELSTLFHERDVILNTLKEAVQTYDIRSKLGQIDSTSPQAEQEYNQEIQKARNSFQGIAYEIQKNVNRQAELMDAILNENESFMSSREASASSPESDTCIAMIEGAIDDVGFFTKHLKEGQDFYNVVSPKLEQVKQLVGDISVRLAVERCEYEDNARMSEQRRQQETEDARMAASFNNPDAASTSEHSRSGDVRPTPSRPGVEMVSHNEPQVRVDDEKVASLVAMDFDPDKVVAALKKYDNNVDMALNELLSG